ncbi:MAG: multicopper oxidase domain-containing protein [Desulfobulbaceae bacterium]|nr:multicopper oxidase domain-containing protein [Desulfobulbaceae bacterium]
MNMKKIYSIPVLMAFLLFGPALQAEAVVDVQCPCDMNGDGDCLDSVTTGPPSERYDEPQLAIDLDVQCMHLTGGDGFVTMADGYPQYMFGFADVTGVPESEVMTRGMLAAAFPAPAITVDEGRDFYLSLTNVGMVIRPDLFDPHTVHFHGFPQSSTVFDGLPESGIAIGMGATLTYFYHLAEPGTFMYHCHVEATEHMQMGMLGNLYVRAAQQGPIEYPSGSGRTYNQFAYNDSDGSTGYDVEYALQLGSFDPDFHDASWNVQPLPFALMWDRYPMINGRGYPDTVNQNPLPAPAENGGIQSQPESSLITATSGQRVLLRLSNLNITSIHTLTSPSIPMQVVGIDAKQLRAVDPDGDGPLLGENLHYTTNSVTMGGGMSADVILDTAGIPAGEYYLYAANLQFLANYDENAPTGGMMTKIVVNP